MPKELVISAAPHETRVAILEDGLLCEIYIEREKEFALVGSIYKGRVTRVLPGMQSAFVDIGLDSDAFLYVGDFLENLEDYDHVVAPVEGKVEKMEQQGGAVFAPPARRSLRRSESVEPRRLPQPRARRNSTSSPSGDARIEAAPPCSRRRHSAAAHARTRVQRQQPRLRGRTAAQAASAKARARPVADDRGGGRGGGGRWRRWRRRRRRSPPPDAICRLRNTLRRGRSRRGPMQPPRRGVAGRLRRRSFCRASRWRNTKTAFPAARCVVRHRRRRIVRGRLRQRRHRSRHGLPSSLYADCPRVTTAADNRRTCREDARRSSVEAAAPPEPLSARRFRRSRRAKPRHAPNIRR